MPFKYRQKNKLADEKSTSFLYLMALFYYPLHPCSVSPAFFKNRFHYPCSLLYVSALMLNPNNPAGLGIHPYPKSMSCIEAIGHVRIIRVLQMDVISILEKSGKCDEWSRCEVWIFYVYIVSGVWSPTSAEINYFSQGFCHNFLTYVSFDYRGCLTIGFNSKNIPPFLI